MKMLRCIFCEYKKIPISQNKILIYIIIHLITFYSNCTFQSSKEMLIRTIFLLNSIDVCKCNFVLPKNADPEQILGIVLPIMGVWIKFWIKRIFRAKTSNVVKMRTPKSNRSKVSSINHVAHKIINVRSQSCRSANGQQRGRGGNNIEKKISRGLWMTLNVSYTHKHYSWGQLYSFIAWGQYLFLRKKLSVCAKTLLGHFLSLWCLTMKVNIVQN